MTELWQAAVLGVVQGLGEFLPISSSAHLVLIPWLLNWEPHTLAFDVALHVGTLLAIALYFWRDWLRLTLAGVKAPRTSDGRLCWILILACIPGALVGMLLEHRVETAFRQPALIALLLMFMGLVLAAADRLGRQAVPVGQTGFRRGLLIGLAQALAILPGVSRAGITMSAGLFLGLTREAAARFSFLLSAPLIAGAALLKVKSLFALQQPLAPVAVGVACSAIAGLLSIRFLLAFLNRHGLGVFAAYRLLAGGVVLFVYWAR
ncbi:MAG: undecaprenyl-diphosphatase UppP [Kiritimatiellaeota bacterium]|nr:undecaprenyl-diphosphatase UppP [Kiritimatiellota bacterium]